MSEERKPTPPSHPRPSRSRFLSVRPLVPVESQTPSSTQNINRLKSRIPRPVRSILTPVSSLQRNEDLSARSLVPTPPTMARSPGLQRRRPASLAPLAPPRRTKSNSPGKHIQQKDEKQNSYQSEESSSQEAKSQITKFGKAVMHKGNPKKGPLFNHASPPSLEYFQKEGFKIALSNSFEALSNGSHIPVPIKSSKSRQKSSIKPSRVNNSHSNDEKPDEVKIVDEATTASRAKSGSNITTDNANAARSDERPSHIKKRQPPSLRPTVPHRLEPLRLPVANGGNNHGTYEDLRAVEENPNAFGRFSSKLQRERHNMKELGGVLRSRFTPDGKTTELKKIAQASEGSRKPLGCSSSMLQMKSQSMKPLGDIHPSRFTPENNTSELEKIISEPSKDCSLRNPGNQMAITEMINEMQQLKDHLKDVKTRQCSKTKNDTHVLDNTKDLDQSSDPVNYVKTLANDMNIMIKYIDLDMTCVHQAAKEVVESMVERLKKSKDNFDDTLLKHEKEILRLQGVNNEIQYSLVEEGAKVKSLEKAMDLTNVEYEKLEKRNAELLEDNKRLEAECQKMNEDIMFRAKILGTEDLLEQNKRLAAENDKLKLEATFRVRELVNLQLEIERRDKRSYQLLDEYHVLWKDKSILNLRVASLETELKQLENARLSLHEYNSSLGCQIAAMEDHIRQLEHRNSFLSGTSDESMSSESDESINLESEIDSVKVDVVYDDTEPQQGDVVPDIGITEHVLFLEDGKIINGLAESSRKIEEEQRLENGFNDTVFTDSAQKAVKEPLDNMVESSACSKTVAEMAGETVNETVQGVIEEILDNVVQRSACSKSVAGMADESITETTAAFEPVVEGMLKETIIPQGSFEDHVDDADSQEPFNGVTGIVAAVSQNRLDKTTSLVQLQTDKNSLGEPVNTNYAQDSGNEQEKQHAAVSQEVKPNASQLEWVIEEQNNHLEELQTIIGILREKNAQLENEKVEIISEHQGFLLENMQEVKRLKKLEQSLNEKERILEDKFLNIDEPLKSKEEADWYEECVKSCDRVRQIEGLMAKQERTLKDLEDDRDRLLKVNKDLRLEMANKLAEDALFLGLPKPLQGFEDIVKQLRKSKVICNGVRKKIRCYAKCDVAIAELQRMKPDTLVISIGDVTVNEDEQPRPKTPITHEQLLIKKPKLVKKHRMKNMQNQLFQNPSPMGSTLNGSGSLRTKHNRKNPSILLRMPYALNRINEGREELLEERLEDSLDEGLEDAAKEVLEADEKETAEINEIAVGEIEGTGMDTAEINEIAVGEMQGTGMDTAEIYEIAVGKMESTGMDTAEINEIAVGEIEGTGMDTAEINEIAVGEMQGTGMDTAEINEIAVGKMESTGMDTAEIYEIAVGEMQGTGMDTAEIYEIAVGEMQGTGMDTAEINEIAVGEMEGTGMDTAEINEIAVGEMEGTGMDTAEINEIAVGEMEGTGMDTAETNEIAVGEMEGTGMDAFKGYADEMFDGSATEMLNEMVFANEGIEKENAEVVGENVQEIASNDRKVSRPGCSRTDAGMTEESLGTEIHNVEEDEIPLESAIQLFESVRKLEILRKLLAQKPSKLKKKKNVDRMT